MRSSSTAAAVATRTTLRRWRSARRSATRSLCRCVPNREATMVPRLNRGALTLHGAFTLLVVADVYSHRVPGRRWHVACLACRSQDKGNDQSQGIAGECTVLGVVAQVCEQPVEIGPCDGAFPRWAFDPKTGECTKFSFGGCGGNDNNFQSQKECEEECGEPADDVCDQKIDPGPCRGSFPRWGFNGKECVKFTYGGCQGNENNFEMLEECKEECGGDVCSLPLVVGPCEALVPVWGFEDGECVKWTYGGCGGNGNRFDSRVECQQACADICTLPIFPPDQEVFCRAAIPRWTYNSKKGACEEFIYSGCGGTANIFESQKECEAACGGRD